MGNRNSGIWIGVWQKSLWGDELEREMVNNSTSNDEPIIDKVDRNKAFAHFRTYAQIPVADFVPDWPEGQHLPAIMPVVVFEKIAQHC